MYDDIFGMLESKTKRWNRVILCIAGVTTNDVLSHTVFAGRRLRFFPNSAAHDVRTSVIKQPRLMALRMVIFLEDKLFASPQLLQTLLVVRQEINEAQTLNAMQFLKLGLE